MSGKLQLGEFINEKGGCRSASGFHPTPLLPDGRPMELFKNYDVRLLEDFDKEEDGDGYYKKGTLATAMVTPNGYIHLCEGMTSFGEGVSGKNFEFIS